MIFKIILATAFCLSLIYAAYLNYKHLIDLDKEILQTKEETAKLKKLRHHKSIDKTSDF